MREYDGKRLVLKQLKSRAVKLGRQAGLSAQVSAPQVEKDSRPFYDGLAKQHPWLLTERLVVKPDMLFGKRGKNNLVLLDGDYAAAQQFIAERMGNEIEVSGVSGVLSTFIIECFVPHEEEFYLAIQTRRDGDSLSFGNCGGVDIEDNWHLVKEIVIPVGRPGDEVCITKEQIELLLVDVDKKRHDTLLHFIKGCFEAYVTLDATMLEMNPFCLDSDGCPVILDSRVELDSYATFQNARVWGSALEFPEPWGREKCAEERIVQEMDDRSGASLKLSVLNPKGRMWTMVAGGGASVIYADQVVQIGYGHELGNYAEYSGNPKEQETYLYARTLLGLVTADPDGRRRALLVGGGVANFSDIAATLGGVQQAITDFHGKLQVAKVKVFVRRGGPNYRAGLQLMRDLGDNLDIPIDVYGPDTNMTHIVGLAKRWIEEGH